jgi:putative solute:sodium symporter small subunit
MSSKDEAAEEEEDHTLVNALVAVEIFIMVFFLILAIATAVVEKTELLPLVLCGMHAVVLFTGFDIQRTYEEHVHKKGNEIRHIEVLGQRSRVIGLIWVLMTDVFSLVLVLIVSNFASRQLFGITVAFWSLATLSTTAFLILALTYHTETTSKSKKQ